MHDMYCCFDRHPLIPIVSFMFGLDDRNAGLGGGGMLNVCVGSTPISKPP